MSYYLDDWPHISPFNHRFRGFFNHTPHHYFRNYQLRLWERVAKQYASRNSILDDFCIGAIKRHKVALDLLNKFKKMYHLKNAQNIAIMHYVENSHDHPDRLNWIDQDLYEFLSQGYEKDNIFNNTAIFLYSKFLYSQRFSPRL
jgi:hypothetical protein